MSAKPHPLARPLEAALDTAPDVYAGIADALLDMPIALQKRLWALKPIQADDLIVEAIAYHDSMRGCWEATPDGIAAWLLAQAALITGEP